MYKKEKEYLEKYINLINKNSNDKINHFTKYKNQVGKLNQKYWNLIRPVLTLIDKI